MNDHGHTTVFLEDALFPAPSIGWVKHDTGPAVDQFGLALIPLRDVHLHDLRAFVPCAKLHVPPAGVDKPERFAHWVAAGGLCLPPPPDSTLVLTSDGSFHDTWAAGSWSVVFSYLGGQDDAHSCGTFIGCTSGLLQELFDIFDCTDRRADPYLAEIAGLLWSAVAVIQMRFFGRVVFRCDCLPAIHGVSGRSGLKPHALCTVARALHAVLVPLLRECPHYLHVKGHAGDFANELADGLATWSIKEGRALRTMRLCGDIWQEKEGAAMRWVPHSFLHARFPGAVPALDDGALCWSLMPTPVLCDADTLLRPLFDRQPRTVEGYSDVRVRVSVCSFNCLSIADDGGGKHRGEGIHAGPERVKILEKCLSEEKILVAALQEARTQAGSCRCGAYYRIASGSDCHGNFGNEIWICCDLGVCPDDDKGSRIDPGQCCVLHSDPTCLVVRILHPVLSCYVASLHAPHRGHSLEVRLQWWRRTEAILKSLDRGASWIIGADANVRVGSVCSSSVGDFQCDAEDPPGECFRQLALSLSTFVPSTFEWAMEGPGGTLVQKRNSALSQSDYICIPLLWKAAKVRASVSTGIHAGNAGVDHFAVVAHVEFLGAYRVHAVQRRPRLDPAVVADPGNRCRILEALQQIPQREWGMSVHEHASSLISDIQRAIGGVLPKQNKRMRNDFFSERTGHLHAALRASRKQLRNRCEALRLARVRCAFLVWQRAGEAISFEELFCGPWLAQLHCNISLDINRITGFGKALRQSSKADKAAYVEHVSGLVDAATPAEMHKALRKLIKPRRFQQTKVRPQPMLRWADGTLCQSPYEQKQRWRQHFSDMEAGDLITPDCLLAECVDAQVARGAVKHVEYDGLPSFLDLDRAMHLVKTGRAPRGLQALFDTFECLVVAGAAEDDGAGCGAPDSERS